VDCASKTGKRTSNNPDPGAARGVLDSGLRNFVSDNFRVLQTARGAIYQRATRYYEISENADTNHDRNTPLACVAHRPNRATLAGTATSTRRESSKIRAAPLNEIARSRKWRALLPCAESAGAVAQRGRPRLIDRDELA
jgi:hypothetical protein